MARNKSGPGKYKQILSGAGVLATSAVSPGGGEYSPSAGCADSDW